MTDAVVKLPPALLREFLAALQAVRPGSVEEELTERVCISLLRDRLSPNSRSVQTSGGTGRPGTANSDAPPGGVSENEWKLMQRARALEDELRLALCAAEDIRALKHKINLLMEDVRKGKEDLRDASARSKKTLKERDMLSDHAEKLMKAIRQVYIEKFKCEEKRKEERALIFKLTQDNIVKDNKIESKRKALKGLVSANARLSKQLEIMDQKFIDLRMRFDAAKHLQNTTLEKAVKEAHDLRSKFKMMTHGRGRLDDVPLPLETPGVVAPNSTTMLHKGEQWMDASQGFFPKSTGTPGNQAGDRCNTPGDSGAHGGKRPATTGGIGRKQRPGTASPVPASPASGKRTQGQHSAGAVDDERDIDKIIEKIYAKQKRSGGKDETVWTPNKLKSLVTDAAGHTGCAIPDITSHVRSAASISSDVVGGPRGREPAYSKITSL